VAFRIARGELAQRRTAQQSEAVASSYELPEHADEVVRALAKLSPKQRAAVVLHHYAGYPVKEIAKMLDSTTAAVKVHLSQGRKRLRSLLDDGDDDA
jgi:RNA polymerase sigma-70 factor (ECF subfamily)